MKTASARRTRAACLPHRSCFWAVLKRQKPSKTPERAGLRLALQRTRSEEPTGVSPCLPAPPQRPEDDEVPSSCARWRRRERACGADRVRSRNVESTRSLFRKLNRELLRLLPQPIVVVLQSHFPVFKTNVFLSPGAGRKPQKSCGGRRPQGCAVPGGLQRRSKATHRRHPCPATALPFAAALATAGG